MVGGQKGENVERMDGGGGGIVDEWIRANEKGKEGHQEGGVQVRVASQLEGDE